MKLLKYYASQQQKHIPILKQILRAIGNCSSHMNSIFKIVQLQYLQNIKLLIK